MKRASTSVRQRYKLLLNKMMEQDKHYMLQMYHASTVIKKILFLKDHSGLFQSGMFPINVAIVSLLDWYLPPLL